MATPGSFVAGTALTAAEMNLLPGGVEAGGYAVVTSTQGSITTVVDLTGLSVTFTAVAGRLYRLSAFALFTSATGGDVARLAITNAANTNLMLAQCVVSTAFATGANTVSGWTLQTFSAGSTTVKCRAMRATGTGTVSTAAGSTAPAVLLVEDVGPS